MTIQEITEYAAGRAVAAAKIKSAPLLEEHDRWLADCALAQWEIAAQLAEANELTRQRLENELRRTAALEEREERMLRPVMAAASGAKRPGGA